MTLESRLLWMKREIANRERCDRRPGPSPGQEVHEEILLRHIKEGSFRFAFGTAVKYLAWDDGYESWEEWCDTWASHYRRIVPDFYEITLAPNGVFWFDAFEIENWHHVDIHLLRKYAGLAVLLDGTDVAGLRKLTLIDSFGRCKIVPESDLVMLAYVDDAERQLNALRWT